MENRVALEDLHRVLGDLEDTFVKILEKLHEELKGRKPPPPFITIQMTLGYMGSLKVGSLGSQIFSASMTHQN